MALLYTTFSPFGIRTVAKNYLPFLFFPQTQKEMPQKEHLFFTSEAGSYFTESSAVSGAAPVRATLRASGWLPPT